MIHGLPNGTPALALHERSDLRLCGASDAEINEVYNLVPNGTPIDIVP